VTELPMFPLGTVLLPHMVLPLHVFEPRYRTLMREQTAPGAPGEFGVTLIERGGEVGGGDVRTDVGCVARLVETQELDDGRWLAIAVGTRRVRVTSWLEDAPYPRAEVEPWPDPPAASDDHDTMRTVTRRLRRVLALRTELGEPAAAATTDIDEDPVAGGYQAAVLTPAGPLDRYRLLAAETPGERLEQLASLLEDSAEVLELRLTSGGGG
jgi:Lon protease-like protein